MQKRILVILGMHRSGTSALAGAIHVSGISGGKNFIPPSFDNVKGFFENQDAFQINEAILRDCGLTWDSLFNLPGHWIHDSRMEQHKLAIARFVRTELGRSAVLYLKDPRLCYLLPLWQVVFDELGIRHQYILALRPAEEVYRSLRSRNHIGRNTAFALWLNHLLLAEKNTRDHDRQFVSYQDLLASPVGQVERIFEAFQLKPNGDWEQGKAQIQSFIEKKLRHHVVPSAGPGAELPSVYRSVFGWFEKLIPSPAEPAILAGIDKTRELFLENLSLFAQAEKPLVATLKVYAGANPNMVAPITMPVYAGLSGVVEFNLRDIDLPINRLDFFPANNLCHVTVRFIKITYLDGSEGMFDTADKLVIAEHGNHFLFGEGGFVSVLPNPGKKTDSIQVGIDYYKIGQSALEDLAQINAEIKDWFYQKGQEQEAAFIRKLEEMARQIKDKDRQFSEERSVLAAGYAQREQGLAQSIQQLEERLGQTTAQLAQAHDELREKDKSSTLQHGKIAELNGKISALNKQAEMQKQELERLTGSIRQKENLIWETFNKRQAAENDYRQALRTLDDLKASLSYRAGMALTWPFRAVYDLATIKPINETSLWLFFQFFITALKMPGRMLANINGRNLKTLRKALANESPREIVANLKKLLSGQNTQPAHRVAPAMAPSPPLPVLPPSSNGATTLAKPAVASWEDLSTEVLSKRKKIVLFTSPNLPDFDGSSGGKRATRMLGLLAEECEVYVFTLGNKPEKHIKKLESLGVRVFRGQAFDEVKTLLPRVDALVFSFFYTYFDCGRFLSLYPAVRVIVDSVDVHWVRHERSRGLWAELTDEVIRKKKALEIEVYKKAEIIWAVTEEDRTAILTEVPGADIRVVSNVHSPEVAGYQDPGTQQLLFFGGFAHYPNILAAKELALRVFPKIREKVPSARLVIAGSNAPADVAELGKLPGVEFLGFIEDSSLSDLYKNTFLALAPLQAGAGIKGKICEAISYKVPVATNSIGNEGITLVNKESGLVSDDMDELATLTVNALRREYDLADMARKAQACLSGLVGPETVKRRMLESISTKEVSICIVTWNRQKLLQRCIESIENHTHGIKYKILVYSNGCTDGTQGYLEAAAKLNPNIVPILSQTNDVFVVPNNRMMMMFPGDDVVLLNNDTYVTPGWLTALRDAAYSAPDIGIVGAKILYPDGRLQEFGSELYADGTGRNIGKGDDPGKPAYSKPQYAGYVSGCAFYVKRSTIGQIGVFDEAFHPCYCEDSDYCYTAWENGLATLVTPGCVIYHDEGGTSGTDVNKGFKAYQKVNFEKFLGKHREKLDETASKIKLRNLTKNGSGRERVKT